MGAVGSIVGMVVSPLISALTRPKAQKAAPAQPVPLPQMTPRSNSAVSDALMARRGSADNRRTGAGGAESSTASKKSLMGM
jgi:hypothetical protein